MSAGKELKSILRKEPKVYPDPDMPVASAREISTGPSSSSVVKEILQKNIIWDEVNALNLALVDNIEKVFGADRRFDEATKALFVITDNGEEKEVDSATYFAKISAAQADLNVAINNEGVRNAILDGATPDANTLSVALRAAIALRPKLHNLGTIRQVLDAGAKPDYFSYNLAIQLGNVNILKLVKEAGAKPNEYTYKRLLTSENKEIIDIAIEDPDLEPSIDTLNFVIKSGDSTFLAYLLTKVKPDENSLNFAIKTRKKEVVHLLLKYEAQPDKNTLGLAIKTKNSGIISFAVAAGAHPDEKSLDFAIETEIPEIVGLVAGTGAEPSTESLSNSLVTYNIDIFNAVRAAGAEPDGDTLDLAIDFATKARNLDIIGLVVECGARSSEFTMGVAEKTGNPEIIRLIKGIIEKEKEQKVGRFSPEAEKNQEVVSYSPEKPAHVQAILEAGPRSAVSSSSAEYDPWAASIPRADKSR